MDRLTDTDTPREPGLLRQALYEAAVELMARGLDNSAIALKLGLEPAVVLQLEQDAALQRQVRDLVELRKLRQYARAVELNARLMEDESSAAGQKAVHEALSQFDSAAPPDGSQIVIRFVNAPDE